MHYLLESGEHWAAQLCGSVSPFLLASSWLQIQRKNNLIGHIFCSCISRKCLHFQRWQSHSPERLHALKGHAESPDHGCNFYPGVFTWDQTVSLIFSSIHSDWQNMHSWEQINSYFKLKSSCLYHLICCTMNSKISQIKFGILLLSLPQARNINPNEDWQHSVTKLRQNRQVKETYRQHTEPWASALCWCCSCRMPPPSGSGWGRCARRSRTRAPRRSRSPASTGTAPSARPPGTQRCCCKGQSGQSLGIQQSQSVLLSTGKEEGKYCTGVGFYVEFAKISKRNL